MITIKIYFTSDGVERRDWPEGARKAGSRLSSQPLPAPRRVSTRSSGRNEVAAANFVDRIVEIFGSGWLHPNPGTETRHRGWDDKNRSKTENLWKTKSVSAKKFELCLTRQKDWYKQKFLSAEQKCYFSTICLQTAIEKSFLNVAKYVSMFLFL